MIVDALWGWLTTALGWLLGLLPSWSAPSGFETVSWSSFFTFAGWTSKWVNWNLLGVAVAAYVAALTGFVVMKGVLVVASKFPALGIQDDT